MHDVENVLGDAAFWTAFVIAAAGTFVVWLRMRRFEVEPGVWVIVAVAGAVGLRTDHRLLDGLVVAIALLALGEYYARQLSWRARVLALAPGSLVLGAALPDPWPFWIRAVAAVAALVGGVLTVESDRRAPRLVPLSLAVGILGVYLCVPDTEASKALLGALVVAAALGLEPRLRHRCGVSAVVGLFVWSATFGGLGRDGSVVGGVACLGVVLLLPLVPRWSPTRWAVATAIVVQVALVLYVSRVAGFEESAWSAAGLAAAALAAGWVLLSAARWLSRR